MGLKSVCFLWAPAPAKRVKTSFRAARCVCVDIMFEGRSHFPHVFEVIAPLYAHGALTQFGRMAWREARSVRQDESRRFYSAATVRSTKHTVKEKMLLECNFFFCVDKLGDSIPKLLVNKVIQSKRSNIKYVINAPICSISKESIGTKWNKNRIYFFAR